MTAVRVMAARVVALLCRRRLEGELEEELRAHREMDIEDRVRTGVSLAEAQREARRSLGPTLTIRERWQDARGFTVVDELVQDLRYTVRTLRRSPGCSLVVVLTLAVGIGANTTMFGVIHAVFLQPLPYHEPQRLVRIWEQHPQRTMQARVAPRNLLDWREQTRTFESVAFWGAWQGAFDFTLVGPEGSERVRGAYVSANLFSTLGVGPILGRGLQAQDDEPEQRRVAVLGHGLWLRRFGGDPEVIGRTLTFDNYQRRDYTIIGVMPPRFAYPEEAEVWLPAGWMGIDMSFRNVPWLMALARLRPGTSLDTAEAELKSLQQRIAAETSNTDVSPTVVVASLPAAMTQDVRPGLLMLQGTVLLVFLIACTNVANLLLANATSRQREIVVRAALGAGRGRLLRQLLTENLGRALAAGGLGVLLAAWGLAIVRRFGPDTVPRLADASLNVPVLAFTVAASLLAALLAGLTPALYLSRQQLGPRLREGGRGSSASRGSTRTHDLLLATEVAMTLMLLVGAGLLLQSQHRLQRVDLGFLPERLATATLDMSGSSYTTSARPGANRPQVFARQLIARIESLPGVEGAAATNLLPPQEAGVLRRAAIQGRPVQSQGELPWALVRAVTPSYFEVMGIPLRRGRPFRRTDTEATTGVAIINETMARRYFADSNPIGQRLVDIHGTVPEGGTHVVHEIVGVVGDVKNAGLQADVQPEIYKPSFQWAWGGMSLVMRTTLEPARLTAAVRHEVSLLNPDQPVMDVRSMGDRLGDVYAEQRFRMSLLSLFGVVALGLAAIGIYGVLDYRLKQRTEEIAVRLALGASHRSLVAAVLGRSLRFVVAGVGLGLVGAALLSRGLSVLLFDISPLDPVAFGGAVGFVAIVACTTTFVAARRTASIDPILALRHN